MRRRFFIVFSTLVVSLLAGLTTRSALAQSMCNTGVTITNTLDVNSAHDIVGRVGRTRPPSVCGSLAAVPGVVDTLLHMYDVYRFVNTDTADACFTITLTWTPGAATMWANAYSSYTVGQGVTTNWIGDVGGNTNGNVSPQSMGITIAAGASIDVVVMTINQWTSTTMEVEPYTLTVSTSGSSTTGCVAPTNVLQSSVNPTNSGNITTFTATVSGPASLPAPTGTVDFFLNGMTLLGSSVLNGSGVGMLTVGLVAPGADPITASYPGDSVYANSVSPVLTQTVNAVDAGPGPVDSGPADAGQDASGSVDAGVDSGVDAGVDSGVDAGAVADSGEVDSGEVDSGGAPDSGEVVDSGAVMDSASPVDGGVVDSAPAVDSAAVDSSAVVDSAVVDSTVVDSATVMDSAVADSTVIRDSAVMDSTVQDSAVVVDGAVADSMVVADSAVADTGVSASPDSGKVDSGNTGGAVADGAADEDADVSFGGPNGNGCSCRVAPAGAPGSAMAALSLGFLALAIRRRRKK